VLRELQFSDLIFNPSGEVVVKGAPGAEGASRPPQEVEDELRVLREQVVAATEKKQDANLLFDGVSYRLKRMDGNHEEQTEPCYYLRKGLPYIRPMAEWGYPDSLIEELCGPANKTGLILFAGSPGAGKTTGASSFFVERLKRNGGTGITVECPCELPLAGWHGPSGWCQQTEVRTEKDMGKKVEETFRCGSPNILYLGEIREGHAAVEVLRGAITSYLVVSTIHAESIEMACLRMVQLAQEHISWEAAQGFLSQAFTACIHQELRGPSGHRHLKFQSLIRTPPVIGKLANGRFSQLSDDIHSQERLRMGQGTPR